MWHELRNFAKFLTEDEKIFAKILEAKTNKSILNRQKAIEENLNKALARSKEVSMLYERLFEEHVKGTVSDE